MARYKLYNNILSWACFLIAALTYILTLEPTASFWDCPEFILQGYNLEVGHPPGNPIFMLAARFFINFAGGNVEHVALMVNLMSALLSAATILLLYRTITHLVKRLIIDDDATDIPLSRMLVILGSGLCGALVYTWSDTFWFSAVEGEVYAFSSFCTALVFWLILRWETRASRPDSDKYLILIAYVIGISIAVHLLNLLCIPAIVLVIYYRLWKQTTAKGSLLAVLLSGVIIALILYGLVPGFIEMAQQFELFCVNTLGMSFNFGVLIYAVVLVAAFVWALRNLWTCRSIGAVRISVLLAVLLSGIFMIGSSWWLPLLLALAFALWIFLSKRLPTRVLTVAILSIFVIFIGYSSYALLLIRSTANPPMNQNAPDNVFALASYLNREQYGETPLLYGNTYDSSVLYRATSGNSAGYEAVVEEGPKEYAKEVKSSPSDPDRYIVTGRKRNYVYTPELNMLFPRMHSSAHRAAYREWTGSQPRTVNASLIVDQQGNPLRQVAKEKPSMADNFNFFVTYQLNHMYWRYFMWNFAGRQNDIQGNGEVNHGNWISGIPMIDNLRLGDQSLLPYDEGRGNKGHNVFFMLPLLLGIIGLGWQAFTSRRGIEQFWVIFFLFFMTGIAIVLYLNQPPSQPRERDYAFAGSFYAFSIWVGMGVAGLWAFIRHLAKDKARPALAVGIPVAVGLLVPIQMVSQTWDDHDRSGRSVARDFGINYLNSLDPNAIIFTNGDNDTFPLWYAQEVEGVRTDVKVVNLSYLSTDWYANLMRYPTRQAEGIRTLAQPKDYAYNRLQFAYFPERPDTTVVDALAALAELYKPSSDRNDFGIPMIDHTRVSIPVDLKKAVEGGHLTPEEAGIAQPAIVTDLMASAQQPEGLALYNVLSLDMLATSMANGWDRPVYFAMTVPNEYYLGLTPYMRNTGLAYEVTPLLNPGVLDPVADTDRAYRNFTERFLWGGLDTAEPGALYLDETNRRMVTTLRTSMLDLAKKLIDEGYEANAKADSTRADDPATALKNRSFDRARTILEMMEQKLPASQSPLALQMPMDMAVAWYDLGNATGDNAAIEHARSLIRDEILRYSENLRYYASLNPMQYASLQRTDRYIDQVYVIDLIQVYGHMGGDGQEILLEMQSRGVNLDRLSSFINS